MRVSELIDRLKDLPPNATIGIECNKGCVRIADVDWGVSKKTDVSIFIDNHLEIVDTDYKYDESDYWEERYNKLHDAVSMALCEC